MKKIITQRSSKGRLRRKLFLFLVLTLLTLSIWVFAFHYQLITNNQESNEESKFWFYFGPSNRPPIDYLEEREDRKLGDHLSDTRWNDTDSVFGPCSAFTGVWGFAKDEKFMWYGSHSGFGNQVIQLKWALRIAGLLNRTLILPPKTPRVSQVKGLGTCGQKVTHPNHVRSHAWNEYANMLRKPNYISLADIIDIKKIPFGNVRTVDFRHFVTFYCGCVIPMSCSGKYCLHVSDDVAPLSYYGHDVKHCLSRCGKMIGSANKEIDFYKSIYTVNFTCSDTVWTIGNYSNLTELVKSLSKKADLLKFAKENANKNVNIPEPRNLVRELGSESPANSAMFLGFGSTFHPRILDMHSKKMNKNISKLFEMTNKLTFTPSIWKLAHEFIRKEMKNEVQNEFFCVHFRGGDAWFQKNKITMKNKIEHKLSQVHSKFKKRKRREEGGGSSQPFLFLMTDMKSNQIPKAFYVKPSDKPFTNPDAPTNSSSDPTLDAILSRANALGFRVRSIACKSDDITNLSMEWMKKEYGFLTNRVSEKDAMEDLDKATSQHGSRFRQIRFPNLDQIQNQSQSHNQSEIDEYVKTKFASTLKRISLDFCFFVEMAVCSCARLGFQGTRFSTASDWISKLREQRDCYRLMEESEQNLFDDRVQVQNEVQNEVRDEVQDEVWNGVQDKGRFRF